MWYNQNKGDGIYDAYNRSCVGRPFLRVAGHCLCGFHAVAYWSCSLCCLLLDAAEEAQRGAMEVDERVGMVEEYLSRRLPENWSGMDIYGRREFLSNADSPVMPRGTVVRTTVSNAEIWCECFGKNLSELKTTDSYAIAALMTQIPGWERSKTSQRLPLYGKQRLYEYSK